MKQEFTAQVEGDPEDYMVVTKDLVEEIAYQFNRMDSRQSTPTTQASALIELSNRLSDLASWHPRYDIDIGEIVQPEAFCNKCGFIGGVDEHDDSECPYNAPRLEQ